MASPVVQALEQAMYTGSGPKLYYWAFRHPNPDAPPQTYRLTRRAGNGWAQLLAASKATGQVLGFYAPTAEDRKAVTEALKWLGIKGTIEEAEEAPVLRLADGSTLVSNQPGGEKPKKK
ncbi:MAG TPA: hypothetical protein VK464_19965 [Symbiobacteriaceae bacterium]|nr:hypothetical protein [Symbiobacteriaceae bacterium]